MIDINDNTFINFKKTVSILNEVKLNDSKRLKSTSDSNSSINKIKIKPQGVIVQDTFNNPFFPIKPKPTIDTAKLDLLIVNRRFRELYQHFSSFMLPWHFCVELVENKYYVFNTRPLNMKFPLTTKQCLNNYDLDLQTKKFLRKRLFDISNAIHICIIGDSNSDIYTKHQYEVVGRFCIEPVLTFFKLPFTLNGRIFPLKLGKKYDLDYVTKFLRK